MSKLQNMNPKTPKEYQDFADTLGEHCQKFSESNDSMLYKVFVNQLIKDLCETQSPEEILHISSYLRRFQQTRSKEEKNWKKEKGNDDDDFTQPQDEGVSAFDDLADFM